MRNAGESHSSFAECAGQAGYDHHLPAPIRILIVDDNVALRTALRLLLRRDAAFDVVGEAADGATSVRLAAELKPDVILMDVQMPGAIDGIEATRRILRDANGARPTIVALSAADTYAQAMRDAGASGFIAKNAAADLLAAIKRFTPAS